MYCLVFNNVPEVLNVTSNEISQWKYVNECTTCYSMQWSSTWEANSHKTAGISRNKKAHYCVHNSLPFDTELSTIQPVPNPLSKLETQCKVLILDGYVKLARHPEVTCINIPVKLMFMSTWNYKIMLSGLVFKDVSLLSKLQFSNSSKNILRWFHCRCKIFG